jgi:uncharacterized membrane protein YphA (DoxX/SURF4 family)
VSISRRIARPLLASIFIVDGIQAIRNPAGNNGVVDADSPALGEGPDNTLTVVRLNGVVQAGGGVLLAIGKFPRLAALALIGTIVPTTYAGQRFWEETDDIKRAEQRIQLLKNLGLLGGLILVAVDTDGAPSVSWRTRRRVRQMAASVSQKHAASDVHAHEVAAKAGEASRRAGRRAKKTARRASRRANVAAIDAAQHTNELVASAAKTGAALAAPYVRQANEGAVEMAGEALAVAGPYVSAGLERAGELLEEAIDAAAPYVSAGFERAGELLTRVPDHLSADR